MSSVLEQKSHDESESKQQAASLHRKPGSLADKMAVLGHSAAESMAPATEWVRTKASAILHPSDSGSSAAPQVETVPTSLEREAREEGKWESEGGHPLDESDGALPTTSAVPAAPISSVHGVRVSSGHPGVVDALRDVGEHIGESVSHLIEPAVKVFKELTDPAGASGQSASVPAAAGPLNSAPAAVATPSAVNSISASSNEAVSSEERSAEKASVAALNKVASLSQEEKEAEMDKMKKSA